MIVCKDAACDLVGSRFLIAAGHSKGQGRFANSGDLSPAFVREGHSLL